LTLPPEAFDQLLRRTGILAASRGAEGGVRLVGGAVRDLLLGRRIRDVDLLITMAPTDFARCLTPPPAAFFPLDEEFGQYRLLLGEGERRVVCDLSRLQGTLEEDLGRRDLTVNAMAIDLSTWATERPPEVIDPSGGAADLTARVARMVAPGAFDADPLRLLRVCRLAAEMGFSVETATAAAVLQKAGLLRQAAPERVRDELVRLVSARRLFEGIRLAKRLGLLPALFPEAESMAATPQDGYHHLNVWEHSVEALRWFEDLGRERWELLGASAGSVEAALDDEVVAGRPGGFLVSLAILFHDVGKPGTAHRGEDGRLHFHGHPARGAEAVRVLGERFALANREVDALALLVGNHLRPGLLHASGNATPRAIHRLLRDTGEWLPQLAALAWCDFLASRGPLSRERDLEGARRFTAELVEAFRLRSVTPAGVPVGGGEIMEALGLPPGPHLERIGEAIAEEAAVNGPLSREEALELARARVSAGRWRDLEALVFDFDNTVSPTFPAIINAFTAAQRGCGVEPLSEKELISRFGPPEEALIRDLVGEDVAERGIAVYREEHARSVAAARLYDGMRELLTAARAGGLRIALVTGRGRFTLDDYLRVLGIGEFFDATLAGDEVARPKPDPEGLAEVLARLGVPASRAAVIGDSPIDMAMAESLGALPLAALWDSAYRRELIEGPARIVFLSPRDLAGWIGGLRRGGTGKIEDGKD
jgi:HAD superfamily hydrolase (TIGR01509 family)